MCKLNSPANHYSLQKESEPPGNNISSLSCLRVELLVASDEGGAGDDFVADLLEGVKEIVGLCTELHPPAPLVLVVGGGARLNQEAN